MILRVWDQLEREERLSYTLFGAEKTEFYINPYFQIVNRYADMAFDIQACSHIDYNTLPPSVMKLHCNHGQMYIPMHWFTRYPLPTTRMWNLLSIFDPPAYTCFFTSLALTVILLKAYSYLGTKMGLTTISEEIILVPFR